MLFIPKKLVLSFPFDSATDQAVVYHPNEVPVFAGGTPQNVSLMKRRGIITGIRIRVPSAGESWAITSLRLRICKAVHAPPVEDEHLIYDSGVLTDGQPPPGNPDGANIDWSGQGFTAGFVDSPAPGTAVYDGQWVATLDVVAAGGTGTDTVIVGIDAIDFA